MDKISRIQVNNTNDDFYRYINFTYIAEKFFEVVEETVRHELVPELDYLIVWEHARAKMREIVDMHEKRFCSLFCLFSKIIEPFPKEGGSNFQS